MVEHSAVNRVVVGSSPTRGVFEQNELISLREMFCVGNAPKAGALHVVT